MNFTIALFSKIYIYIIIMLYKPNTLYRFTRIHKLNLHIQYVIEMSG